MNVFRNFQQTIEKIAEDLIGKGHLPEGLDISRISVDPPRDASHGDMATNAAMVLAKPAGMKPRDLAALFMEPLNADPSIKSVEIAGPGFINVRFTDRFWHGCLGHILEAGVHYGDSDLGEGIRINVEYVSANPTGPMHVGHCRGAVVGDALASLLAKAGYSVTREYYINDAGAQVDALARSLHVRYRIAAGDLPENAFDDLRAAGKVEYGGGYLIQPAVDLFHRDGDKWIGADEADWIPVLRLYATDCMMEMIRQDLAALGVAHDVFVSEQGLVEGGGVSRAIEDLEKDGLIYEGVLEPPKGMKPDDWEPREQTLFRASRFGDDTDRPIRKSDGSWTYFASDIAYHRNKYDRGFAHMIDVWGADHGGYVKRMTAAVKALTGGSGTLNVRLCQMVNLLDKGEPVKMSKRAGTFVTLRDVVDRVGKDVVRFIMLTRKNDAQLDFDYAKVTEQAKDNPVFYVQYAHARCRSVLRDAPNLFPGLDLELNALTGANMDQLGEEAEIAVLRMLAQWPKTVESAALSQEPHRIAYYLYDLASQFHVLWHRGNENTRLRILVGDDPELSRARLALVRGVETVIASGLHVIGVEPVEELRS